MQLGFYGHPKMALKHSLKSAYDDFESWMAERRITCSQSLFKPGMDPWTHVRFPPNALGLQEGGG